jgi:transposase-like protein
MQTCIVHLIRQSLRFVPDKHRRQVAKDLRPIDTAVDVDAAAEAAISGVVKRSSRSCRINCSRSRGVREGTESGADRRSSSHPRPRGDNGRPTSRPSAR